MKEYLPQVELKSTTTLESLYQGLYSNYKYRLVYIPIIWAGLIFGYIFKPEVISEEEKKKIRARDDYLKSLNYEGFEIRLKKRKIENLRLIRDSKYVNLSLEECRKELEFEESVLILSIKFKNI